MLWLGERPSKAATEGFFAKYWSGTIGKGLSDTQREQRAMAEREFAASKPPLTQPCVACGSAHDWIAYDSLSGRGWACQKCHRPSTLTVAEWGAELAERRKAEEATAAEIAAANTPAATRAALKEAVAKHGQSQLALQKLTAAAANATSDAFDARHAVQEARKAVQRAANVDGDALVAAVLADAPIVPGVSQRQAREALAAAEEAAEEANALATALAGKVDEAKTSLSYKAEAVKRAAVACIRAQSAKSIAAFMAETRALQAQLIARMRGLELLVKEGIIDDTPASHMARFLLVEPRHWEIDTGHQGEIAGRWQASIDRLTRDATAPAELK